MTEINLTINILNNQVQEFHRKFRNGY
jgi:hypothetical protein